MDSVTVPKSHLTFEPSTVVSTPINIDRLEQELSSHPDRTFVQHLISGLRNGFDTGIQQLPEQSFICKNLLSAVKNPEVVTDLLSKELSKGYLIGPFDKPPYAVYRINPLGVAERKYSKKQRLIVDLSAPHNSDAHFSLNSLIDKNEYSLSYTRIDDAIDIIKRLGVGSVMNKTDVVEAFKIVPIRVDLWKYHGVKWNDKYYFFTRLCFGSRSSPKIFSLLSEAIYFIAKTNYHIREMLYLLDDFLTIDPPGNYGISTMCSLTQLFCDLNIPIHPDKTLGPDSVMVFLGITLDSNSMQASLPREKIDRILDILKQFLDKRSITKRELLSLLGHLNYASSIIRPGRSFVSYLLTLAHSVKELHHHVRLNNDCQSDINMWKYFLEHWNGISFFYDSYLTNASDIELYTDASGSYGYGAYYQGKWFSVPWPSDLPKLGDDDMSIAFMELVPIVTAVCVWSQTWCRKRICFHSDNQSTVNIIKKGRSKSPLIMKLMRRLTISCAMGNFTVVASFLPGRFNLLADWLSRSQINKFRALAPRAEQLPTPVPPIQQLYFN